MPLAAFCGANAGTSGLIGRSRTIPRHVGYGPQADIGQSQSQCRLGKRPLDEYLAANYAINACLPIDAPERRIERDDFVGSEKRIDPRCRVERFRNADFSGVGQGLDVYFCDPQNPGSGGRMRTPTAYCDNTSRRAPTYRCTRKLT